MLNSREKQVAAAKSRIKKSNSGDLTSIQKHVTAMRSKGYDYSFDPMLQSLHDAELEKEKKSPDAPIIKGQPENKSILNKLKTFLKSSKDPKAKYLIRKLAGKNQKKQKPLDMKADPMSGDTESDRPEDYYLRHKLNILKMRSMPDRSDDTHKPEEFKLHTSSKLKDIVNDPLFQALTRNKHGQKAIEKGIEGMVAGRRTRSKEIKLPVGYIDYPTPSHPGEKGFSVLGDKDNPLDKGASPDMLRRMKQNKLFNRSMDGQTKIVVDRKSNPLIDKSGVARDIKRSGKLKSITSREYNIKSKLK